jgi:hypothetical protein
MMNIDISGARRRTMLNLALDGALFVSRRAKAKPAV